MRLINETKWDTEQLRALTAAAADRVLDPGHRRSLVVLFNYAKRGGYSGHAFKGKVWGGSHRLKGSYFARVHVPSPSGIAKRLATADRFEAAGHTSAAAALRATTDRGLNTRTIAAILTHELLHTLGHDHTRERNATMNRTLSAAEEERCAWADAFPIGLAAPKAKPPIAERETKRIAYYETMLAKWTTKAKRAETVRKGWARRLAMAQSRLGREAAKAAH